jgi:GNAT superfamily N-acetyltransferase
VTRFVDPEPLSGAHKIDGFQSGEESLDLWLARHARTAGGVGSAKTYVVADAMQSDRVVGYHALTVASISQEEATLRATKGMGNHPVPAILLSRLAVDLSAQGSGVGAMLLQDAMLRTISVSEDVGIRLLLAHALNDSARHFYLKFGFEESPTDRKNLQIILKDIRPSIRAAEN